MDSAPAGSGGAPSAGAAATNTGTIAFCSTVLPHPLQVTSTPASTPAINGDCTPQHPQRGGGGGQQSGGH
jgi:hypothetical protein